MANRIVEIEVELAQAHENKKAQEKYLADMIEFPEKWTKRFHDRMRQLYSNDKEPSQTDIEEWTRGYYKGLEENKQRKEEAEKQLAGSIARIARLEREREDIMQRLNKHTVSIEPLVMHERHIVFTRQALPIDELKRTIKRRAHFTVSPSVIDLICRELSFLMEKLNLSIRENGGIMVSEIWEQLVYNALMDLKNIKKLTASDVISRCQ